jgi:hypothetical protein
MFGLPSILVAITVSFYGIQYQISFSFLPATLAPYLSSIFNQQLVPLLVPVPECAQHLRRAPVLKVLQAPRVKPAPRDFSVKIVNPVLPIARLVMRGYLVRDSA